MAKTKRFRIRSSSNTEIPFFMPGIRKKPGKAEDIRDALNSLEAKPIDQKRFAVKAYLTRALARHEGRF